MSSPAASLEGGSWTLAAGVDSLDDVEEHARPSAMFADGRVSGSTGCNRYTTVYTVDGEALELGPIAMTRMACPPPADAVERAYVAALAGVAAWGLEEDALVLLGADGRELLRFVATTAS